jgi:CubicO group peptidase (beta-lactamase class C family)
LASLTKVYTATMAVAQFYQRGQINLNEKISSVFPQFSQNGKQNMTIRNLLLHNSGLPAGPTPHTFFNKLFGCPGILFIHNF